LPCRMVAETRTALGDRIEVTLQKDGQVLPA
jgi:hypothetical protein